MAQTEPEPSETTSLQEARRAFTRKHVSEAARELFCRQGYAATTLEQIARAAGTRRTTLYSHFRDKEEILAAISNEYHEGLCKLVDILPGPIPTRDGIETWIGQLVKFVEQERVPATIVIGLGTSKDRPDAIQHASEAFLASLSRRLPAFDRATNGADALAAAWARTVLRELSFACLEAARNPDADCPALSVAADLFEQFVRKFG